MVSGSSRRHVLAGGAALAGAVAMPAIGRAAVPTIRYSTAGGLGPNEIETVVFTDFMRKNVLTRLGKAYALEVTYARATPEAATMLAAEQMDMAILTPPVFASTIVKEAVPNGLTIVGDCYQDGRAGYASQAFFVLDEGGIAKVEDLRGKTVAVNAFGSTPDVVLGTVLQKHGLDPHRDLRVVEIAFPSIGAALRAKRVDCGVLPLPFGATEQARGGVRPLFSGRDVFEPYTVVCQVARNDFLKNEPDAVKAFLADYVDALHWLYDKNNRKKAIEITAEVSKSPPDVVDSYFLTTRDYYRDPNACVTPSLLQPLVDAMSDLKLIDRRIDMAQHVTARYLPFPCQT